MIPLSTSRIYLLNVNCSLEDEALVKNIYKLIKNKFSDFRFKNIEIKTVKSNGVFKKEIHINHLFYLNRRNFDLETSNKIRLTIVRLLKYIPELSYEQIHLINDGFDRKPSLGLFRGNV